jgi:hypothetical protein
MALDLDCALDVTIKAPLEEVERALHRDIGSWFVTSEPNLELNLELEPNVGGRLFRNLGNGQGHLWGNVSVLKPGLLEIVGPFFFPEPVHNLLRFRCTENDDGTTKLSFTHQAIGMVTQETAGKVAEGWTRVLEKGLKEHVERNS